MVLPTELRRIYNNLCTEDKKLFTKFREQVLFTYDLDASEYLVEFQSAKKRSGESDNQFNLRLMNLYRRSRSMEANADIDEAEQKLLSFLFLQGIDQSSANSIRLVVTDEDMKKIGSIVKHAKKLLNTNQSRTGLVQFGRGGRISCSFVDCDMICDVCGSGRCTKCT